VTRVADGPAADGAQVDAASGERLRQDRQGARLVGQLDHELLGQSILRSRRVLGGGPCDRPMIPGRVDRLAEGPADRPAEPSCEAIYPGIMLDRWSPS